jgi:serine/threonine protein kinase
MDSDACGLAELLGESYDVRKPLGTGGFGWVYEAYDKTLNTSCAVKLFKTSSASKNSSAYDSYAFEKENYEALDWGRGRPWMPTAYTFCEGRSKDQSTVSPHILMELLGPSIHDLNKNDDLYNDFDFSFLATTMLDAVEQLHCENILHQDIKPKVISPPPFHFSRR